jgi:CheY-specific phosphatase CheX
MSLKVESGTLYDVVSNVFKTMSNLDVSSDDAAPGSLTVAAMVGLTGEDTRMTVIIRLDEGLALKTASAMLGEEFSAWGPAVEDVVAELANIVAGNLKPHLRQGLALSLPTVVHGSDFSIRSPRLSVSQSETFKCLEKQMVVILAQEG